MAKIFLDKIVFEKEIEVTASEYTVSTDYEMPMYSWAGQEILSTRRPIKFLHELKLVWTTDDIIAESDKKDYIVGDNFIILPEPPNGYQYVLKEDGRKKCAKCGKRTEFYSIAPYSSKYDGEPICAKCIDGK